MKKASIKVNFGYNLVYNILNILIPLITAPYTSRVLGADNIGINSFTNSIVSTLVMFGALGSSTYGQKVIASVGDDVESRSKKFWEIWCLKAVTTLIAYVIFLTMVMGSDEVYYFLLQTPFFAAGILDISFLFSGMEMFKYIAIRNSAVRIICLILIFVLVKSRDHLWIYILIVSISQLAGNLSMWPYLKGNIKRVKVTIKGIVSHASPLMLYFIPTITHQIYAVLDKAMLGWLVGSDYENGYYEQAHKIVGMIVGVISAYTVVMRARMSSLYPKKAYDEIKTNLSKSYNLIPFLTFPMTFGLAAIASTIVPWFFGEGYEPVAGILQIFSPIFIFMGYSLMIGTHILTPSGRQRMSNRGQIAAAAGNVILNAILIPSLFSAGAAIASVASEVIIFCIYLFMVRKEVDFNAMIKSAWKKLAASTIMFFTVFPLRNLADSTIAFSFLLVAEGAVVYILVLWVLKDSFLLECFNMILKKIGRREKKTSE